jgi:hypothetical protein
MDLNAITKALEEARAALDSVEMQLADGGDAETSPDESPEHEASETPEIEAAEKLTEVEGMPVDPFKKKKPNPFAK